jgi:pilus assembly protein CpaE
MSRAGRLVAVGCDPALMTLLKAAARNAGGLSVEAADQSLSQARDTAAGADAVFAVVDPRDPALVEDLRQLARSLPERRIIVAMRQGSAEEIRGLFRAGAADVLLAPFSADAITDSLSDLLRAHTASAERGRVVSVLRGVGGAGATTVALNLAALLSRGDARLGRVPLATAFLDLDLQFGDSDLALDLQPRTTVVDVLRASGRLDGRFLQSVLVEHASGVRLLAPPPSMVPLDAVGQDFAPELLSQATALFPRVVVDLPGAWTDWTLQVLGASDLIVLVTAPTVAGALGARRVLHALREARLQRPVFLIINRMDGLVDALEKPGHIARSLEHAIDATLPMDPLAARAGDRGALMVDAYPKAKLSKELRALAGRIEQQLAALDGPAPAPGPVMAEAFA